MTESVPQIFSRSYLLRKLEEDFDENKITWNEYSSILVWLRNVK